MGTLLVAAFIQSKLQCIVLPNQQIRIECAGGCQKVSPAHERGFPLFSVLQNSPFVPPARQSSAEVRICGWLLQNEQFIPSSVRPAAQSRAPFLSTAQPGQVWQCHILMTDHRDIPDPQLTLTPHSYTLSWPGRRGRSKAKIS